MNFKELSKQEKTEELKEKLDVVLDDIFCNENDLRKLTLYFQFANLYNYSFINQVLIYMQKGTIAQSFNKWKKLNRYVKKGERGHIFIFVPMIIKIKSCRLCNTRLFSNLKDHFEKIHSITNTEDQNKNVRSKEKLFFTTGKVFDIIQTDGKPLEYKYNSTEPLKINIEDIIKIVKTNYNYNVIFSNTGNSRGFVYGHKEDNNIYVSQFSNDTDKFKTIIHELAHKLLLHTGKRNNIDRDVMETEAEAVSFIIQVYSNLDTELSQTYIKRWNSNKKKIAKLKILSISQSIIKKLEGGLKGGKK